MKPQQNKYPVRLLIVEDDKIIRSVYRQILLQTIESVDVAENGEEGYEMFLKNNPDVILTDIKMPVMNGLDMINKIRAKNKAIRIVIMSAYGDSRFFLKAIESGVKGFLTKPVNNQRLKEILEEQINDVLLERNLRLEEALRQKAEHERDRSENILQALSQATAVFLSKGVSVVTVNDALARVGTVTNVSRVYIFKKETFEGEEVISQIYEWVAQGVEPQIDNEDLTHIPTHGTLFTRWTNLLSNQQNVVSIVKDIENEVERRILEEQQILSVLAIPIFVKDQWWGFIGFDDCLTPRDWSDAEINALRMLASNLGGAIHRRNVEDALTLLNRDLEQRVKERTKELEQEVTDRRFAEEMLRESEEKYRLIYENANDGILLIKKGVVFLVNPTVGEIFDCMPRDIIGQKFSELFLPKYISQLEDFFNEQLSERRLNVESVTVEIQSGKWIELRSSYIYWDGEPSHLVFASDVSKRKKAEQGLFELNAQLGRRIDEKVKQMEQQQQMLIQKSKLESIGELSAGLAHEINQPLGGISMGIENIQFRIMDGTINNDYLIQKVDNLFGDIERIRTIIDHVRIFSRDQEKTDDHLMDINEVIENALLMVKKQFADHHVDLQTISAGVPLMTKGNKFRLEQVLLNLLSNSKYAVEERARREDNEYIKQITISAKTMEGYHQVIVEDNGTGIDEKTLNNIFDPFFTTKSEEKGTGLGLSISYGIITDMKGRIDVESELHSFTRIIIHLPIVNHE